MKANVLKIAVLGVALAAASQVVRTAHADESYTFKGNSQELALRLQILLQKKIEVESVGGSLSPAETIQLYRGMDKVMKEIKTEVQTRTESPTV
ncbi:MAG: hypothetical protein EOP06_02190 [Proteobacteria bacterium]|nr:MAG: hypothetical protein EOP06_02190 [Pseudomonadota bacterium]